MFAAGADKADRAHLVFDGLMLEADRERALSGGLFRWIVRCWLSIGVERVHGLPCQTKRPTPPRGRTDAGVE